MERHYKHLDAEERGVILAEHRRGSSLRQIGRLLGRHHGTIGLELVRGAAPGGYDPQVARQARDAARRRSGRRRSGRRRKLVPEAALYDRVRDRLIHWCWSPEQIAAGLRRMHPDDPSRRVSHETIHAAIHAQPRGELKALMIEALRQAKPKRGARRTTLAGSAMVPETLRIIHRPEDVEARLVPGHREGDLIRGAFNRSAVGTVVERKTRLVILGKMNGCTASATLTGFTRQMKRLPVALRRRVTCDRGPEMACHPELARRLKIDIWFCDPHAPSRQIALQSPAGQCVAARLERKHQRTAPPVLDERHRPERSRSDHPERRRTHHERKRCVRTALVSA